MVRADLPPDGALSVPADAVSPMTTSANDAAVCVTSAANQFRGVASTTENETTKRTRPAAHRGHPPLDQRK